MEQSQPILIGVAGTNGAGKDTVGEALSRHGFFVIAARDVIGAYAKKKYGVDDEQAKERDVLNKAGNEMRRELGPAAVVHVAMEHFAEQTEGYVGLAVTSLRAIAEAEEVKARGGFVVYVDAPAELRWQRVHGRGRDTEAVLSLEQFVEKEQLELKGLSVGEPKAIQHIEAVGKLADLTLFNEKNGIEEFETEAFERLAGMIPALQGR